MSDQHRPGLRLSLTGLAMLGELAHVTWEHFNGGVISHHLLHRSDMPAISNGWGLLLVPALTWFLAGRIQRRIALHSGEEGAAAKLPVAVVTGFVGSLLFGILLAVSFTMHYESIVSYLFQAMLLLAVLLPVYRAECVLGFVLGMTFTFGAVLPTVVASAIGAGSAVLHLLLFPSLARIWHSFHGPRSPSP